MSLAVLGLALVAGAITVVTFDDQTAREADARLTRHADVMAGDISSVFVEASRDLRLARLNSTYDAVLSGGPTIGPSDRSTVEGGITYVGERYRVDEICLIRANGAETARWNGGVVAPVSTLSADESGNPFFKPAMQLANDSVFITHPYLSPDSHRWVYGFATPIVAASGVHAGVLHFEIPLERLATVAGSEPLGTTSSVLVVDQAGDVIVDAGSPNAGSAGPGSDPTKPLLRVADLPSAGLRSIASTAIATSGSSGIDSFDDGSGASRIAYRPIPGTDLILLSISPTAELYADVERARSNLVATVGPLILLILVVSAWFALRLGRSNQSLARASRASSELASIVTSADDAIFSLEPDGRIATWNRGAEAVFERTAAEAVGQRLDTLFVPEHGREIPPLLNAVMAGTGVERHEAVHRRDDGSSLTVWLTFSGIRGSDGGVAGVSVIARDISDRKQLEQELARQALHDSLTGLPNRVLFHDRLRQSLNRRRRTERVATGRHAVLFVDLDNFKVINDTLGHRVGDELLIAVAARLRDATRSADTAARLGGDEFTVLLENIGDEAEAAAAADRILEELRRPFALDDHQIVVSASIGIAFGEEGADDPDDVLRCADTALYEAKGRGKGRHETYHETMNVRAWRRLELESELRRAITRHELRVHYQPIVELETGRVMEVEALVRWSHPTRGLIAPGEFIPVAEQTGLIGQIGAFVLDTACRQLAEWRRRVPAAADLVVSVNVSPSDIDAPSFVDTAIAAITRHNLVPGDLKLEITETTTLESDRAGATLRALHERGVRMVIDDFGTGYSSLGYFRELPIDALKIDRVFVDGLGTRREDTAIVTAAIAFGRALDVEVVAEGIETELQMNRLRDLGCRLGQGFLFSRPVPAAEIPALLMRHPGTSVA